jgi:transposase InsO family protein
MKLVQRYYSQATTQELCKWLNLGRSSYYYKPSHGKKGAKASSYTLKNGQLVPNEEVVNDITKILEEPYAAYGYEYITHYLRKPAYQYKINKKKVYRLMDENHLLMGKVIRTQGKREFVKHRKIVATKPMEYLCLDIKFVWVAGEKRHYYLLSIMDVYSRRILDWLFQKSIRKMDVINLFRAIKILFGIKGVCIRNDNGSQFIANMVRAFLKKEEAIQEFTHIATPEENSYIEAFHSILEHDLLQREEFASFYEAKRTITAYINHYNNHRLHRSLRFITPVQKWAQGMANCSTDRQQNAAPALLSRPIDAIEKSNQTSIVPYSLYNNMALAHLCLKGEQLVQ